MQHCHQVIINLNGWVSHPEQILEVLYMLTCTLVRIQIVSHMGMLFWFLVLFPVPSLKGT